MYVTIGLSCHVPNRPKCANQHHNITSSRKISTAPHFSTAVCTYSPFALEGEVANKGRGGGWLLLRVRKKLVAPHLLRVRPPCLDDFSPSLPLPAPPTGPTPLPHLLVSVGRRGHHAGQPCRRFAADLRFDSAGVSHFSFQSINFPSSLLFHHQGICCRALNHTQALRPSSHTTENQHHSRIPCGLV